MLNLRPHPGKLNQNPHFNKILGNSCVHSSLRSPALKHGEPNVRLYRHFGTTRSSAHPLTVQTPRGLLPSYSTHILSVFICFEAKSQSAHPDHNPKPNSQGVKRRQVSTNYLLHSHLAPKSASLSMTITQERQFKVTQYYGILAFLVLAQR